MDVCKPERPLQKQSTARTRRRPLVPADNKDGVNPRTREVSSRCRSPIPSAATGGPKRCPSPTGSRLSSTSNLSAPKMATSTERKRPSRPSSPQSPSTPVIDTTAEMLQGSRKIVGNGLPESLWPSTMRSLSVSFQSDAFSVPASKKEKPVSHVPSDRTVKPSSNSAYRQVGIPASRKPTPERKRSPLKGKNSSEKSENSKPLSSSLHPRLVDQHRWPTRTSSKMPTSLNGSIDLAGRISSSSSISGSENGAPSPRVLSLNGTIKPLQKSSSDLLMQISRDENGKTMLGGASDDCDSPKVQKYGSSSSSDRAKLANAAARAMSLPTSGPRAASPLKSRGLSPSCAKPVNPSSRGLSPARVRPSSPSRQPQNSTSVLSFIADIKKGKKAANHIEEVHELRLLYNRHLQWRYANARADGVAQFRKVKAEKMLYSILRAIADLWDAITEKRIKIQQLKLKLNLYSVLNNQLTYLDKWASVEMDHLNSLTWTIRDLQSSTIRIPFTGGAKGDMQTVKAAVCSAVDVMQTVVSSLCSAFSRVEGMNCLVSELADVAANERAMLDECESILNSTAALQVEEYSRRAHLLQTSRAWRNCKQSLMYGY